MPITRTCLPDDCAGDYLDNHYAILRSEGTQHLHDRLQLLPLTRPFHLPFHLLNSIISLQLEHFCDALAGLEELILGDFSVAVEVTLAETALHFVVDLVVVQGFALEEVLRLGDAANGDGVSWVGTV